MKPNWHGILVINKERGLTSHQVVADLRRVLKQVEVGHTGTLDPEATGVLVVGLGQATRSFPFLNESDKEYRAEIILGQTTDTQDATGNVLQEQRNFKISLEQLNEVVSQLTGEIQQLPPMYSAVKVNGQKLYDLARQGIEIERNPRLIKVFEWRMIEREDFYGFRSVIPVEITCSKGTYIRTLIHDLGMLLGVGAHMGRLIRLRSGEFTLAESLTISQVKESLELGTFTTRLIPIEKALQHLPSIIVSDDDSRKIMNGGKLSFDKYLVTGEPGMIAIALNSSYKLLAFIKLGTTVTHCYWQPVRVFHSNENK